MTPQLRCAACKQPVADGATRCPHCRSNLDPTIAQARGGLVLIVFGVLLSLTFIGAIVGIPMILYGVLGKPTPKPLTEPIE